VVHSFYHKEELMDRDLVRFRQAAARENRGRRDVRRRRYSSTLRQQAVTYCLTRRREGERLRDVAAALGVAPWSLHRWMKQLKPPGRFAPVEVVAAAPSQPVPGIVIVMSAAGPRIEGLDVEAAARLLALLP
jgi:transposase-like protein